MNERLVERLNINIQEFQEIEENIAILKLAIYQDKVRELKEKKEQELKDLIFAQATFYNQNYNDYKKQIDEILNKTRHLAVPRQLHAHAVLVRVGMQPSRSRSAGPRRGQEPDRARRNGARDREHDLVHGGRHRHPRRHVHRQGQHLHAQRRQRRHRGQQGGRARTEADAGQPPVRHRPSDAVHGGHAALHPYARRQRRSRRGDQKPQGQKGRHDLGVQPVVRQAALRAAGRCGSVHAVRHGRHARVSRGLRDHGRRRKGRGGELQKVRREL